MKRMNQYMQAVFVMLLVLALAVPGFAAYSIRNIDTRISAVAGETLVTGNVVTIKDADGYAWKADANDAALRPAVGIVGKGGASGTSVEIITRGRLTGWTTLSESGWAYLSETAGAVTQSAPAYAQIIGFAINTTDYYFNFANYLDTSALTALGVLSGASPLIFEGATANDFETTLAITDPTADRTITFPDAGGVPILSPTLVDVAHAITGGNSLLLFEGTTADAFETTVTVTDPTADRTITFPDATGIPILAAAVPEAANAVSGASNGVVWEGATADAHETTITVTDPTADRTITLPDASGVPVLSAGVADVAHAITGGNSLLVFEGATADAFETTLTLTDPTADRTVTIPNRTGQVQLASAGSVLTPGVAVTLTVGLSNVYTLALNDNEDTTITFSGAGTAGDELTIVFATGAGAVGDEVVTFHATLVSSTGTLTCANTASRFYAIRFISDGTHWYEVSRTAIQT